MSNNLSARAIKIQGNKAEKDVSNILNSLGSQYHVFDNVLLKTKKGTTQIDHVVISNFGIFVIETKSHKGMIFGDCDGRYWTQVLYSKTGNKHYQFYSPFLQNYGHLKSLYELFELDCSYFLGLIVFTNNSVVLKNVQCPCVITIDCLASIVKSYCNQLLTDQQVAFLCNKLKDNNCQSKYRSRKHVEYVKKLKG